MWKEFKKFALKGNATDLAIGIVIGGAFQKIVASLVEDLIMPLISIFTGKLDFSEMVFTVGSVNIKYGNFITAVINFLIIAFSIFIVMRYLNKLNELKFLSEDVVNKFDKKGKLKKKKKKEIVEVPETKICPYCLTEVKYKAVRCPNCTSELEKKEKINETN